MVQSFNFRKEKKRKRNADHVHKGVIKEAEKAMPGS